MDLRSLAVASLFLPRGTVSVESFASAREMDLAELLSGSRALGGVARGSDDFPRESFGGSLECSVDARAAGRPTARTASSPRAAEQIELRLEDLPRLFEHAYSKHVPTNTSKSKLQSRPSVKGVNKDLRLQLSAQDLQDKISRALDYYDRAGATILHPQHAKYPAAFSELEKPPLVLSVLGNVEALHAKQRLAIVGSRELAPRTERWLERHLTEFLKACPDACIVSGGARGADQAAHLAAIRANKPTVAFLPSGLNWIFPRALESWIQPILESGGAVVSAYAPDDDVRKHRFEARNRLIASLAHLVFIAEAGRRSGTMMTARLARDLGRELCVLPAFPGELVGQGSLDLIRDGATMICDSQDLVAQMWAHTPRI